MRSCLGRQGRGVWAVWSFLRVGSGVGQFQFDEVGPLTLASLSNSSFQCFQWSKTQFLTQPKTISLRFLPIISLSFLLITSKVPINAQPLFPSYRQPSSTCSIHPQASYLFKLKLLLVFLQHAYLTLQTLKLIAKEFHFGLTKHGFKWRISFAFLWILWFLCQNEIWVFECHLP